MGFQRNGMTLFSLRMDVVALKQNLSELFVYQEAA